MMQFGSPNIGPGRLIMQRRSFLKAGGAIAVAAGLGSESLLGRVPTHNFDKYDFGADRRTGQQAPLDGSDGGNFLCPRERTVRD